MLACARDFAYAAARARHSAYLPGSILSAAAFRQGQHQSVW